MSTALVLKSADAFEKIGAVATEAITILADKNANEFSKSYVAACAMAQLRAALTDDVMRPIMALQGSSLGFKTDKDRDGGYDVETVRTAAIVAMLSGLRLHGNEFNIIGGNCYAAVMGCDRLFNSICAEPPRHAPGIVRMDEASKRATVNYSVTYRLKGSTVETVREQEVAVKLQYSKSGFLVTTDDAVIGKARRKVLWSILREVRGIEIGEGEIEREQVEAKKKAQAGAFDLSSDAVQEGGAK